MSVGHGLVADHVDPSIPIFEHYKYFAPLLVQSLVQVILKSHYKYKWLKYLSTTSGAITFSRRAYTQYTTSTSDKYTIPKDCVHPIFDVY